MPQESSVLGTENEIATGVSGREADGIVTREDDPGLWDEIDALIHHSGRSELKVLSHGASGNDDLGTVSGSEDGILSAEK